MAEQAERWMEDMRKYRHELKESAPFVHSLALFAEFQTGMTPSDTFDT